MSVRCIGIYWNSSKRLGLGVAEKLIGMLRQRGVDVCLNADLSTHMGLSDCSVEQFDRCQLLIV